MNTLINNVHKRTLRLNDNDSSSEGLLVKIMLQQYIKMYKTKIILNPNFIMIFSDFMNRHIRGVVAGGLWPTLS